MMLLIALGVSAFLIYLGLSAVGEIVEDELDTAEDEAYEEELRKLIAQSEEELGYHNE